MPTEYGDGEYGDGGYGGAITFPYEGRDNLKTPKFKFPFLSFEVLEQDSAAEISQSVEVLLRTPVGSEIDEPEYGVVDLAFRESNPDIEDGDITEAIAEWEPRAQYVIGEDDIDEITKRIRAERDDLGGPE